LLSQFCFSYIKGKNISFCCHRYRKNKIMTTKTNILTFDIGKTKLWQYDRTTLVSNTINTVYAAFSKSDNCTWKSTDMWRVVSKGTSYSYIKGKNISFCCHNFVIPISKVRILVFVVIILLIEFPVLKKYGFIQNIE
jgi:hypothetical protein